MPNTFIHGYKGKFLIGSTDFAVTDFNLDWSVDDPNVPCLVVESTVSSQVFAEPAL